MDNRTEHCDECARLREQLSAVTAERDRAIELLNMLDRADARHPDVAEFLNNL
jgi:hypothetical protein